MTIEEVDVKLFNASQQLKDYKEQLQIHHSHSNSNNNSCKNLNLKCQHLLLKHYNQLIKQTCCLKDSLNCKSRILQVVFQFSITNLKKKMVVSFPLMEVDLKNQVKVWVCKKKLLRVEKHLNFYLKILMFLQWKNKDQVTQVFVKYAKTNSVL